MYLRGGKKSNCVFTLPWHHHTALVNIWKERASLQINHSQSFCKGWLHRLSSRWQIPSATAYKDIQSSAMRFGESQKHNWCLQVPLLKRRETFSKRIGFMAKAFDQHSQVLVYPLSQVVDLMVRVKVDYKIDLILRAHPITISFSSTKKVKQGWSRNLTVDERQGEWTSIHNIDILKYLGSTNKGMPESQAVRCHSP